MDPVRDMFVISCEMYKYAQKCILLSKCNKIRPI